MSMILPIMNIVFDIQLFITPRSKGDEIQNNTIVWNVFFVRIISAQIPNDDCGEASLIEVLPEEQKITLLNNMLLSMPSYCGNMDCGYYCYKDLWYKFIALLIM